MKDRIAEWISWKLPKRVVYFAVIRAAAHATTHGAYGATDTNKITALQVLKRWGHHVGMPGHGDADA